MDLVSKIVEFKRLYEEEWNADPCDEALEAYFSTMDRILDESVPVTVEVGKYQEAMRLVNTVYLDIDCEIEWMDDEYVLRPAMKHWHSVIPSAPSDVKDAFFSWFIDSFDKEEFPEYLIEAATATLLRDFNEPRFLEALIERYKKRMLTTQMQDIRDHSAGVLCDLYERLGGHEAEIDELGHKYGAETGFLIAICDIWRRRGDRRAKALLEDLKEREEYAPAFRDARKWELDQFLEEWGG